MKFIIIKQSMKIGWATWLITSIVEGIRTDNYMPLLIALGLWVSSRILREALDAIRFFKHARMSMAPPKEPSQESAFWLKDPDLW